MKLLVTGGCGFIGSNFIHYWLSKHPGDEIVNLDKLTYAGNPENLKSVEKNPRYKFIRGDVADEKIVEQAMNGCDTVVNFAAESHVDRSINDPLEFIQTDVVGAFVLLEQARKYNVKKFVQISTDEVYGQILEGSWTEETTLNPRNPYSASKAGADRLAYSFFATYGLPVVISRASNNFGPYQFPEKLIPLFVTNLMERKKVPVYGDGMQVRDWLYVKDHCSAIDFLIRNGKNGEVYNVAGGNEKRNIDIIRSILKSLKKSDSSIERVPDRIGHDRRYSLDGSKLRAMGWKPEPASFESRLQETIQWYVQNTGWWKPLKRTVIEKITHQQQNKKVKS